MLAAVFALWAAPLAATAQTRISMPKNKYSVQDDIKLGEQASVEVEREFPLINNPSAEEYISSVGQRLVNAIPQEFQQSAFRYRFKIVNASDINAFALPGGPMYVNRGMIQSAKNEGEMAGVMAHEISHVALRHATAQQTKQGSVKNTLGTLGLILGGAVLGGQAGAQAGMIAAAAWQTKYSREYETQADILGSRIMANAGYDPKDLANMFQTIAKQGGGRAPEWLSSHPDPGDRYNRINREAGLLQVKSDPIKVTRGFENAQAAMRSMAPAKTMAQIEQDYKNGRRPNDQTGNTSNASNGYSRTVQAPSTSTRVYTAPNGFQVRIPSNWQNIDQQDGVWFAPSGAYGNNGITHGLMLGVYTTNNAYDLNSATTEYIDSLLQANTYLRARSQPRQTTLSGQQAFAATLSGTSPITGKNEIVNLYTVASNNSLLYIAFVVPENESMAYANAFRNISNSLRIGN